MRRPIAFLVAMAVAMAAGEVRAVTNVFDYPLVFRRHQQLSAECRLAMSRHDALAMERTCRAGMALLPENATWRYNLGCALALQGRTAEAFAALNRALDLGFRDEALLAGDSDLARLRALSAYPELLDRARSLRGTPGEGQSPIVPAPVLDGQAHVSASNTRWDIDGGFFRAFFLPPTNVPPPSAVATRWNGPAAELIRPWLATNAAAGNCGDFYDNRDDGHSRLDVAPFAGLTPIVYDADARRHGAHYGLDQFLYNGVTFGNASVAYTVSPFWHSVLRGALADGTAVDFLVQQYLHNHIYCYPSHRDHDASGLGDLYPVNQPYVVVSQGSSGSDQPFLGAIASTLAAFQPATKRFLTTSGLIAPTVQMLLRTSQKTVARPEDCFAGVAHPSVFDAARLDVERMVRQAHALTTNDIPPVVALRVLEEARAVPGVDFFDAAGSETLCNTPFAIGRILRGTARRHTLLAVAQMLGAPTEGWSLRWVVLRGDPRKITILPRKPDQSLTEIAVWYHDGHFPVRAGEPLQSSRVDIGVFAVRGTQVSAPSFLSFFHLDNEIRTYADDGRILAVDYAAAATNRYVDPRLSLAKHWRDEYAYDSDRNPTGWIRYLGGGVQERFTARGERVEQADRLGRPLVTRTVVYLPRSSTDSTVVPDLICVDGEFRIRYRYFSDNDFSGEVESQERVKP